MFNHKRYLRNDIRFYILNEQIVTPVSRRWQLYQAESTTENSKCTLGTLKKDSQYTAAKISCSDPKNCWAECKKWDFSLPNSQK